MRSRAAIAVVLWVLGAAALPADARSLKAGEPLPAFVVDAWDGGRVQVEPAATKVVLIEIWASWCAPCREALPAIASLTAEIGDPRLQVFAVSIDRERNRAERFLDTYLPNRGIPIYHDPEGRLPAALGAAGMPTTCVAVDGIVRAVEVGFTADAVSRLRAVISEALESSPGSTATPVTDSPRARR